MDFGETGSKVKNESGFSCEHKDLLQLALAILIRRERELDDDSIHEVSGFRTPVTYNTVESLVSHIDVIKQLDHGRHWIALAKTVKVLVNCMKRCPTLQRLHKELLLGPGKSKVNIAALLLRLKFNVFPIHDVSSNTRQVGLGCFPFASFFNHSCEAYVEQVVQTVWPRCNLCCCNDTA